MKWRNHSEWGLTKPWSQTNGLWLPGTCKEPRSELRRPRNHSSSPERSKTSLIALLMQRNWYDWWSDYRCHNHQYQFTVYFFPCCAFSLSSFLNKKINADLKTNNTVWKKNKFFSLVWFHFKAFRFTHFCYFLLLKLKCGIFFLKIACQVMKTEFHPWSMEAQEKESGDNQYNLGIGNWNWNDKTLKRKQKEEWSREGVKSQQKKRGQNLRKGVKIWEKGLESEKKRSKSEKKGSKSGWPSDHSLAASVAIFASPPCLLNSHIMILYPGPGIRFSKRTFDIFVPG